MVASYRSYSMVLSIFFYLSLVLGYFPYSFQYRELLDAGSAAAGTYLTLKNDLFGSVVSNIFRLKTKIQRDILTYFYNTLAATPP